ncbi:hypothetical protein MKK84_17490 [Methylobacterium sp. E-065]|uniref:hypothetical protein n=1 Tax=Methylobacterium sp. E-065 TaxID=2836583 RepID=UPI001FB9295F|nr:hypothetical protein [Methylobacterium sp. E-065]MCJ2019213.1 hypothetical protein [Methylobacterium sp. E-065]
MISTVICGHFQSTIFFGKKEISSIASLIDGIPRSCDQDRDMITSLNWFLSLSDRWNTLPVVVLLHRDRNPFGALLLHGTKFGGVPIGTFRAGYLCGRGGVVGKTEAYSNIIEYGTEALIKSKFAHTVIVTCISQNNERPVSLDEGDRNSFARNWQFHETRSRLPLTGGMDGLLSRFSQKMRKNFRYYKKRAEIDIGCVFQPSLSSTQAISAVEQLQAVSVRSVKLKSALQRQRAIADQPGSFSMGLIDKSGDWVSYLSGWRQGKTCVVEWQLNHEDGNNASISMAMRHFFLEHEIANGMEEVIFLAGTTPIWSRVCEPQLCGEYLATPGGLKGKIVRGIYGFLHPNGKVSQLTRKHKVLLKSKYLASFAVLCGLNIVAGAGVCSCVL